MLVEQIGSNAQVSAVVMLNLPGVGDGLTWEQAEGLELYAYPVWAW